MQKEGISIELKNAPVLDPLFFPFEAYIRSYLKGAQKPVAVAVRRNDGLVSVFESKIYGTPEMAAADRLYLDRLAKLLLWLKGGCEIAVCGHEPAAKWLAQAYRAGGEREFDWDFMSRVYERPFAVEGLSLEDAPQEMENAQSAGGHLAGCRIGFDAGGSDRKVSAVIDGESVYSEEVVWFPKQQEDPDYHYEGILAAFRTAASKMPRVDAIGVSSAGIYINNRTMAASLFIKVPEKPFHEKAKDIYIRAAQEIGEDIPLIVANDGDVTALAGAMSLGDTGILGIAMGTSEAAGFVDGEGKITGWLNELAFAPVDLQSGAPVDEWSLDKGVGCKYFSQDAVIRLAPAAGIRLEESLSLAEKLKAVQALMEDGDERAAKIFETIGCYLGHTLPLYHRFYSMKHVLLMGRVTSGKGGDRLLAKAKAVLAEEYPEVAAAVNLQLPDERSRRVGQSVAAASLPECRKED